MGTELNQDPDDWRRLRDINNGMAPVYHERAKNDPDYVANFYLEKGYAAHAFLVGYAVPHLSARSGGWTSVAEGYQSVSDESHTTAGGLEEADSAGSAGIRRTAPEM
ncbi:hypothetical protein ACQP2U_33270 [Nocardia sp. CA-084685]|uniref:hypothetical protein n=1 Tax=Nocardia sp. CA-084685 TaxID=3239970 RepID=UPI003D973C49